MGGSSQYSYIRLSLIALLILLTSACTALQTFPQAARQGDSIALAVGSADGMTRSNTTASYVSDLDPQNPVDLTPYIRAIFKLYADKSSIVYEKSDVATQRGLFTDLIVTGSGHEPWVNVMVLDLPGSGLQIGTGRVEVRTTAIYPSLVGSHINDLELDGFRIDLEIIPGVGQAGLFTYQAGTGGQNDGNLVSLEPLPHALVAPLYQEGNPQGWPDYGAIELKVNVTADVPLNDSMVRIIVDDMTVETESGRSVVTGINGNEVTVLLLSTAGKLRYYEPRFNIVLRSDADFTGPPTLISANYYNIDGDIATGPAVGDYTVELR